jgi:hypothetical protein
MTATLPAAAGMTSWSKIEIGTVRNEGESMKMMGGRGINRRNTTPNAIADFRTMRL